MATKQSLVGTSDDTALSPIFSLSRFKKENYFFFGYFMVWFYKINDTMKEKNSNVSKKYPYLCDKAGKNCKNEDVTKSMDSTGEE